MDDASPFRGTDRFEVRRRVGAGTFGVVYEAFDRERSEAVALKTLRRWHPRALYRFKQEFRALADVAHPNLVALHELVADGEDWFFTMELLRGEDFVSRARRAVADAAFDALRAALAQLAGGVAALHAAGWLHRDLKPPNVLVTADDRVVVLDFGLVAEVDGRDAADEEGLVGSPAYLAPECAAGDPATAASDAYAVGLMLFEALAGRRPFEGRPREILHAKCTGPAPDVRALAPSAPADLAALCNALLARAPGDRPTVDEIARSTAGPSRVAPSAPSVPPAAREGPFVGRERHLAALAEAYASAESGRAVVVHVHGASGMGKTTLVRRFLDGLRRRDPAPPVFEGRCYERESVPFNALDSVVDALSRHLRALPPDEAAAHVPEGVEALARLFPVLAQADAVGSAVGPTPARDGDVYALRARAAAALRSLLARLAARSPAVLFIDDLQWGDADSAALVRELLAPPTPPRLLLIACYRTEDAETSVMLKALQAPGETSAAVREIVVGAMDASESRALVAALLGPDAGAEALAGSIAAEADGSPFFANELVRHRLAAANDGAPRAGMTLQTAIEDRVARLPDDARAVLELAAVAGQPIPRPIVFEAAGLRVALHPALDLLRTQHLVRVRRLPPRQDHLEVYHDRIRETLVRALPPDALRERYRRLADALESIPDADPETLATYCKGAGLGSRAAAHAVLAADRAARALAFDRAARMYAMALELRGEDGEDAPRLRIELARALAHAGRAAEAARAYLAAAAGARPDEALRMRREAAEQWFRCGHIDEGFDTLADVLSAVGLELPRSSAGAFAAMARNRAILRLRGYTFRERSEREIPAETLARVDACYSVGVGLSMIDGLMGQAFHTRGLLEALDAGEPHRVARSLAWEAAYTTPRGGAARERTAQLVGAATDLARRLGSPHALALTTCAAGMRALHLGEWPEARALLERAAAALREQPTAVTKELHTIQLFILEALLALGELREHRRRVPEYLRDAATRADRYTLATLRTSANMAWLVEDDPAGARENATAAMRGWTRRGFHVQHFFHVFAQAQIDVYEGDGPAALHRLDTQWSDLRASTLKRAQWIRIHTTGLRGRAALASMASGRGDRRALARDAERAASRIEAERMAWAIPLAALLRAGLAAQRGDTGGALSRLADAERTAEAASMALYAAVARRYRGALSGGEVGRAARAGAEAWMASEGVRHPARMSALFAPGVLRE